MPKQKMDAVGWKWKPWKMVAPRVQQTPGPGAAAEKEKLGGHKMHLGPVWEDSVDDSADSLLG